MQFFYALVAPFLPQIWIMAFRNTRFFDARFGWLPRPAQSLLFGFVASFAAFNVICLPEPHGFTTPGGRSINMRVDEVPGANAHLVFIAGGREQKVRIGPAYSDFEGGPWRSRAISFHSFENPLVLAYSSAFGASDCTYTVTPIGIKDGGALRFIPSSEVAFSNEGGIVIWAKAHKTQMVVWNPIWAGKEGHYDAHRYAFYLYSWNSARHRFHYARSIESEKPLEFPENVFGIGSQTRIEISYRTRAYWFPEAAEGC
jgi:hypothetical protein